MTEHTGMSLIARKGASAASATVSVDDLAQPVLSVPADIRAAELDEMFRMDRDLRWVVLRRPDGPVLVQRSSFEVLMAGRLGYGRLLHAKRPVHELEQVQTLVFAPGTPVASVASTVIDHRDDGSGRDGVLVVDDAGVARVVAISDIFERLALHFAHQSLHDAMTGLPNRLFLMQRLAQLGRAHEPAVLMYVDLDRFKDVNDQLGHAAGDQVLVKFSERLRSVSRKDDLVARLGGDEFAVLSTGTSTTTQSRARAERLVLAAAAPFLISTVDELGVPHEHEVFIGASVGVAHSDRAVADVQLTSLDVLLKQADLAMYRAKSHGRGRVEHFAEVLLPTDDDTLATRTQRDMERRLRIAIDEGLLTLHYQPVVALPGAAVVGVEALARWQDPELGSVPPDQFVPLAERTGLILDLGRWVLRTACAQAAQWQVDGRREGQDDAQLPVVSVNVSPIELAQPTVVEQVAEALATSGLAAHRLCLEVTETAAVVDLAETKDRLQQLAALGVRIALDDFGTGHSSLTMLRDLPVDVVKIDRSFVRRMSTSTADAVLVRLVVDTAHSLGMTVCAEGLEDAADARQLIELGCDTAQGWYFGMPEPSSPRLDAVVRGRTPVPTPGDGDGAPGAMVMPGSDELILVSDPDGVITFASATSWTTLGRPSPQVVGTTLADHVAPDDHEALDRARPGSDVPEPVTVAARHRDGSTRFLSLTRQHLADGEGTLCQVLTVARDVTDAVTARIALDHSEQQFRLAFDQAPIGMALTRLDGTFVSVNAAFERLVGRTARELLDITVADITHPDDLLTDKGNLDDLRAGAIRAHHVEKRYVHAAGHPVDVSVSASLVGDPDSGTSYLIAHVLSR